MSGDSPERRIFRELKDYPHYADRDDGTLFDRALYFTQVQRAKESDRDSRRFVKVILGRLILELTNRVDKGL